MEWQVPLADLDYDETEERAVMDVLRRRWLTMGQVTQQFEQQFAELTGAKHVFAVSNATVALHMACLSLGIGPGDEVIVPSLTFVATANSVLYTGAEVRFADILGEDDLNLSPESIESQITPKTKAISLVHYGGYPCRMEAILEIAKKHGLAVIEDAAHASGAYLKGKHLGAWGDVGCFSFFSNKNLSTGEGGMLVTNRDDIADKARLLRSHGMTSLTWDRHQGHAYTYDVVDLGYNYRIDEIHSALGLAQLGKLAKNNARRKEITQIYRDGLKAFPVGIPFQGTPGQPAYHLAPILLPKGMDRLKFIDSMKQDGIQTSIHYPPAHKFSYYRKRYPEVSLPATEDIAGREVTLPLYPGMTDGQVRMVIEAVGRALEAAGPNPGGR